MKKQEKIFCCIAGLFSGLLNGLLGAGGGLIIVPMLQKCKVKTKMSHATSVAIIFSMCLVSAVFYIINGKVEIKTAGPYLLWGLLGSIVGSWFLTKIKSSWLSRLFGLVLLWAAYKMLIS